MVGTLCGAAALFVVAMGGVAAAETRTLDLYNAHTRERLTITFKKNGQYIPAALSELNHFLRDWRRNEEIKMDPRLFDTVWELYQKSGATQPIHVVCGYRSLATNEMLRSRSSAVAKHSQHTLGKAMDMFIPGVSIDRLREIGIKMQHGGVGWYPTSGSPFVHIDVGNVRAWPRMTRTQLVRLFPDGKTVHLPSSGPPLAGYQQALAELKRNGNVRPLAMASADGTQPRKGGLLAMLFGGDEEDTTEEVEAASDKTVVASAAPAKPAKPAASTATVVRTEPAAALPGVGKTVTPPPIVVAAAPVPKPTPAPERPEPVAVAAAEAPADPAPAAPAPAETVVAVAAPLPTARPDLPAETVVAALDAPIPPRPPADILPPAAPVLALAALPGARPSLPTVEPEPANAQLALAEVAHDPVPPAGSATALGYASPTAFDGAEPKRPPLQLASLAPPPAATRGLMSGQADPLAALPQPETGRSDPLVDAAAVPAAADLPIYDGGQSTYWGVFAQLVHPDQRRMGPLLDEPARVIVSTFAAAPYGTLMATRFTGEALPRLQVMRFTVSNDLAMR